MNIRRTALSILFFSVATFPGCGSRTKDITLLCLGSGKTIRFKQDTLQTMALPSGAEIQFRYTDDLIPSSLQQRLESRTLSGASVLLGFVDNNQRDSEGYGSVLPLRYGKLLDSARVGRVFILRFELEEFAVTKDLESLQKLLPRERRRKDKTTGQSAGALALELPEGFPGPARSTDIKDWDGTIAELVKHDDFKDQTYFLNIRGVFARGNTNPVELKDGECILGSENEYELKLYYLNPKPDPNNQAVQWLNVEATDPWLRIETPHLPLDSFYDVIPVQLGTPNAGSHAERTVLMFHDKEPIQNGNRLRIELYVPVRVEGTFLRTLIYGSALGVLLAFQQLIAIFSSKELRYSKTWLVVAAFGLGILTGIFLAFGLAKPGG